MTKQVSPACRHKNIFVIRVSATVQLLRHPTRPYHKHLHEYLPHGFDMLSTFNYLLVLVSTQTRQFTGIAGSVAPGSALTVRVVDCYQTSYFQVSLQLTWSTGLRRPTLLALASGSVAFFRNS